MRILTIFLLGLTTCGSTSESGKPIQNLISNIKSFTLNAKNALSTSLYKLTTNTRDSVDTGLTSYRNFVTSHGNNVHVLSHLGNLFVHEAKFDELSHEFGVLLLLSRQSIKKEMSIASNLSSYLVGMLEQARRGDRDGAILYLHSAIAEVESFLLDLGNVSSKYKEITSKVQNISNAIDMEVRALTKHKYELLALGWAEQMSSGTTVLLTELLGEALVGSNLALQIGERVLGYALSAKLFGIGYNDFATALALSTLNTHFLYGYRASNLLVVDRLHVIQHRYEELLSSLMAARDGMLSSEIAVKHHTNGEHDFEALFQDAINAMQSLSEHCAMYLKDTAVEVDPVQLYMLINNLKKDEL